VATVAAAWAMSAGVTRPPGGTEAGGTGAGGSGAGGTVLTGGGGGVVDEAGSGEGTAVATELDGLTTDDRADDPETVLPDPGVPGGAAC